MNKYKAKSAPCLYGHIHDSKLEAERCNELHLLLKANDISDLKIQEHYLLIPAQKFSTITENEQKVEYIADFVYFDNRANQTVIEDTKGMRTKDYILKRKLLKNLYCNDNTIFVEKGNEKRKINQILKRVKYKETLLKNFTNKFGEVEGQRLYKMYEKNFPSKKRSKKSTTHHL